MAVLYPLNSYIGIPGDLVVNNPLASVGDTGDAGDPGLIPGWGGNPERGHGNSVQYCCLENPMDRRSLEGYSPWGCKQ